MIFRPQSQNEGENNKAPCFDAWASAASLFRPVIYSTSPSVCQCHRKVVEDIFHSNFRILQMKCSHSWIPHSKGDDDPVQFPAGIRTRPERALAMSRHSPAEWR